MTDQWGQQQPAGPGAPVPDGPPAPGAPQSKKGRGKTVAIFAGAFVVVLIAIAAATGGGMDATASKPAASPAAASSAPAKSAAKKPTTVATTAAAGLSKAAAIKGWYSSGGLDDVTVLQGDLTQISVDGQNADSTAMLSDCAKLSAHVSKAQAFDPIPDTAAQSYWSKALLHLGRASSDCTQGVAAMNTGLMTKAGAEITTSNGELTKATARIGEIANGLN